VPKTHSSKFAGAKSAHRVDPNTWQTNASLNIEELCSTPGNFVLFTNSLLYWPTVANNMAELKRYA
jgi:hypothetical protein